MNLPRLLRTLRYVPPHAVAWRVWARLKRRYYRLPFYGVRGLWRAADEAPPRWVGVELVAGNAARGHALAQGQWELAGQVLALGVPPRSWAPPKAQALQLFEMHYHEWLADLREAEEPEAARALVADWLLNFGHYHPLAWHPYPTSLRLVAWLTHGGWLLAEAEADMKGAFCATLRAQLAYLRHNCEWDLGGNHLLKNLKALLLGGLAVGDEALQAWAEAQMLAALGHQVLADGAHDERTPHYHAQVLQDVLEVRAALRAHGRGVAGAWDELARRMGGALAFYMYPDGALGLWNDGVEGEKARLQTLLAQSGFEGPQPLVLAAAGYGRLEAEGWGVVMDAGKVGPDENPGHAHADTLAIECWVGAQRVFVNQGTLAYQHPKREALRGTAAHSTLALEGENSAEVWGAHRVGRRPRHVGLEHDPVAGCMSGVHDGYRHVGLKHRRTLMLRAGVLEGRDMLSGPALRKGKAWRAWVRFHVHPAVTVRQVDEHSAVLGLPNGQSLMFTSAGRLMLQPSQYAAHWNQPKPTQQLAVRMQGAEMHWSLKQMV